MARMSQQKLELLVGTFVIAGMILIGGMILTVSGVGLFNQTYYVVVRMTHVGDLQLGAPVKRSGVMIGRVDDISLQSDHIRIVTQIEADVDLTSDAKASIETAGVVGDTFLEFSQGQSSTFLPKSESVDDALTHVVPGLESIRMNELFHQVKTIGTELTSITKNVNEILGDDEVKADIKAAISNTNAVTAEATRLLKSLNRTSQNVELASKEILDTTQRVKEISATVKTAIDDTVGDEKLRTDIRLTVANARKLSDELLLKKDQIDAMLANIQVVTDDAKVISGDAKVISAKVKEIASAISPNTGVMPLFTSEDIRKEVDAALIYLRDFISHEGIMKALALNRIAGAIAEKRLEEWKAHYTTADELEKKALEYVRQGVDGIKEGEEIIDRQNDPFLQDR